jgi:hypothetical protein
LFGKVGGFAFNLFFVGLDIIHLKIARHMKKWFLNLKTWQKILVVVFAFGILGRIFGPAEMTTNKVVDEAPKKDSTTLAQEKINALFSAWDGSLPQLEKIIKKSMNDPDSYEHVETKYWVIENNLIVLTSFRGKNGFGGTVKNYVKAKVDFEGNVIEIIEEGK